MKIKFLSMILGILVILVGCSSGESLHTDNSISEQDIKISNNEFKLLDSSKDKIDSAESFSQVKAFIPDENYTEFQNVQDSKFSYIKLGENNSTILGKIILENKTNDNMKIQSFFIQGNSIAKIKTRNSEKWVSFILYNVEPNSSVEINVEIEWSKDELNELTYFPNDLSSPLDRYNGGNISLIRYFVLDDDTNIANAYLNNQAFTLDNINEIQNFFPVPNWVDNENKEIEYIVEQEQLFTTNPISKLKLNPIPYNTNIDILLLDDKGYLTLLFEKIKIEKNKTTFVPLNSEIIKKLNESTRKNYLIILNNRDKEMLIDMKALDLELKPFSTTYQSIIEFYKESNIKND